MLPEPRSGWFRLGVSLWRDPLASWFFQCKPPIPVSFLCGSSFCPEETSSPSSCPGKAMTSIQGVDALLILDFQYTSSQLPVHLQGTILGFFNSKEVRNGFLFYHFSQIINTTFLPFTLPSSGGIRPMPKLGFSLTFPDFQPPYFLQKGEDSTVLTYPSGRKIDSSNERAGL